MQHYMYSFVTLQVLLVLILQKKYESLICICLHIRALSKKWVMTDQVIFQSNFAT